MHSNHTITALKVAALCLARGWESEDETGDLWETLSLVLPPTELGLYPKDIVDRSDRRKKATDGNMSATKITCRTYKGLDTDHLDVSSPKAGHL